MPTSIENLVGFVTLVGSAYSAWLWDKPRRDGKKLEDYLRERRRGYNQGRYPNYQQTETHLKRELGLNPDELLKASNRTRNVNRVVTEDSNGMAKNVLYEYSGNSQ